MENSAVTGDPLEISLYEETEQGPFLVEEREIERIATELHRSAQDRSAESLAAATGCAVYYEPDLLPTLPATIMPPGVILVRPDSDKRRMELVALREVARWKLQAMPHSRGDVWRLTLALAIPLPLPPAMTAGDACAMIPIPKWAIEARLARISA